MNITESEFVIHLGVQITAKIYNHCLSHDQWEKTYKSIQEQFPEKVRELNIYHLKSLTYEVDENQSIKCYTDHIDCVNTTPIPNSLTYQRHRTFYNYDFQPTNQYYNIKHLTCHDFRHTNLPILITFRITHESKDKDDIYEIIITYNDSCEQYNKDVLSQEIILHLVNNC
jgi:hypothetical protein